jgi:hypothetical protein
MLFFIATLGCASGPSSDNAALEDYEAAVLFVHDTVDAYASGVIGQDLDGVATMQGTYETDMEHALEELMHAIEDVGGCDMGSDMMTRVDEAEASHGAMEGMEGMEGMVTDLVAGHADHTDAADCETAAEEHEVDMDEEIESLEGHHAAWLGETMTCGEHMDDEDEEEH